MSLSLEQMQFLADKGLSLQDVIEFQALMPKRSKAAERQARYRARQRGEDVTDSVTCDVTGDVTPPSLSLPPNEKISNPPTHTHPEKQTRARKGHRLPVDWEPEPLTGDLAAEVAAWPAGAIERELARFRDWAASANGPNAIKTNWQAAWRNWVRKANDEGRYRKPANDDRPRNFSTASAAEIARQHLGC